MKANRWQRFAFFRINDIIGWIYTNDISEGNLKLPSYIGEHIKGRT
ncbi:hypothetical protein B4107_0162 [Bacillus safensis]|nr:hypothetical protein B4107_0162 [Bacillus safensis]